MQHRLELDRNRHDFRDEAADRRARFLDVGLRAFHEDREDHGEAEIHAE